MSEEMALALVDGAIAGDRRSPWDQLSFHAVTVKPVARLRHTLIRVPATEEELKKSPPKPRV